MLSNSLLKLKLLFLYRHYVSFVVCAMSHTYLRQPHWTEVHHQLTGGATRPYTKVHLGRTAKLNLHHLQHLIILMLVPESNPGPNLGLLLFNQHHKWLNWNGLDHGGWWIKLQRPITKMIIQEVIPTHRSICFSVCQILQIQTN